MKECDEKEIWILGLGDKIDRATIVVSYLAEGNYRARTAKVAELAKCTPLAILVDISPWSEDGWGILMTLKSDPTAREIPVLPIYLGENGQVGQVFRVGGFFTLPIDLAYLQHKLGQLGLADDSEDYDLQAMVVSRKGEEQVAKGLTKMGFEVVNAYTGKEAIAIGTTIHPYMTFCSLMLPDMAAFELLERFRLYPQTRNIPFFVLLKDNMKDGERLAMSRGIDHLVRKKGLTQDEFLSYFKKSNG